MKRMNSSYRLQVIKEVMTRRRLTEQNDPMANHISQLLDSHAHDEVVKDVPQYSGSHFDEDVGGWISNAWDLK
ncbi:hypothetical protein C9J48_01890 [Photobacterium profundum]|uniref:Uncharacterized protein n=2 Tax=Photobacterium TaxID=657 RepID=A0A2T3JCG4_9GAMM|nr:MULTISPECIES: hypothetical protein [Photobacterium]EAS40693.1 hypothetical protein P3TCK_17329 [Photobacterium profundum 3TCK]PSU46575.1 hypothetical protein C9J12_17835 [Photobacterium frigidiphilum]PSV64231.1 hypothetical protein C9J48_01890 [Photobacterium profundum]